MIGPTTRQSALFSVPLARQAVLLKDDLLDPVDALLDDAELVGLVRERLARRRPLSPRRGRPGIAPDRLLRCCVMKHLKGWSFRELEREVRSSLVYRRFTRFDADPTPNYSTFSRCFALLGPEVTPSMSMRGWSPRPERRMWRAVGSCEPTRPWSKVTFTTPRTAPCWETGSGCSLDLYEA